MGTSASGEELCLSEKDDFVPVKVVFRNRDVVVHGRHHKQEDHDFLVGKLGRCIYCVNGSKLMSREEINRGIE